MLLCIIICTIHSSVAKDYLPKYSSSGANTIILLLEQNIKVNIRHV